MKLYEIEILEEPGRDAKAVAAALICLFGVAKVDIEEGPNGNPLLFVETPTPFHYERSFKLWLMEGPSLTRETIAALDPLLEDADETYLTLSDEDDAADGAPSEKQPN